MSLRSFFFLERRPLRDNALNELTPDKQTPPRVQANCTCTHAHPRAQTFTLRCVFVDAGHGGVHGRGLVFGTIHKDSWVALPLIGSATTGAGIWVLERILSIQTRLHANEQHLCTHPYPQWLQLGNRNAIFMLLSSTIRVALVIDKPPVTNRHPQMWEPVSPITNGRCA